MEHVEAVDTLAIERYLLEEMTQQERESFEEHFFSCAECAEDARAAVTDDRRRPQRPRARHGRRHREPTMGGRAFPPGARPLAHVGRVALGGRRAAGGRPRLPDGWPVRCRRATIRTRLPLTPSTLRPASRGQEAVCRPAPGASSRWRWILAARSSTTDIRYELARADGKTIASGDAPTPASGAPLLLMLPATTLKGSEQFVLTLHNPGAPGLTPTTYRFRLRAP